MFTTTRYNKQCLAIEILLAQFHDVFVDKDVHHVHGFLQVKSVEVDCFIIIPAAEIKLKKIKLDDVCI